MKWSRGAILLATLVACGPSKPPSSHGVVAVGSASSKPVAPAKPVPHRDPTALPLKEALPIYREWTRDADPAYIVEGITQLAWARDPEAASLTVKALSDPDSSSAVRITAARALAELGDENAKFELQVALGEATKAELPYVVWGLVALGEQTTADAAADEYAKGTLQTVTRLDGDPAFSMERLAAVLTASDAPVLDVVLHAKNAGSAPSPELVAALGKADRETWTKLVFAIAEGVGTKGLLHALNALPKTMSREERKKRTWIIFELIHRYARPADADLLVRYLEQKPEPHWRTQAASCLAELGDLRALPTLVWRMQQDPLVLYKPETDPELRLEDTERVTTARDLIELASLHPERRAEIRKAAYAAVRAWATSSPQPPPIAARFFAAVEASEALPLVRQWATRPLKPMGLISNEDWHTTASALRYLGAMKDAPSWKILESQFEHPAKADPTHPWDMLKSGAIQGFSEWGDHRAVPLLIKLIEDPQNSERLQAEAGRAFAWLATDAELEEAAKKVHSLTHRPARLAYVEALARKPAHASALVDLVRADTDATLRRRIAYALGSSSLPPAAVATLRSKLDDPAVRIDAALALILGGSIDDARAAMRACADPASQERLESFPDFSGPFDFPIESIKRWLTNAEAASHMPLDAASTRPASFRTKLNNYVQSRRFDEGPHTWTRTTLPPALSRPKTSP